jgi:hypothetical protein
MSKNNQTRRDLLKTITAMTGGLMIPFSGQSQIAEPNTNFQLVMAIQLIYPKSSICLILKKWRRGK